MKALLIPFSGNLKICFLAIFFVISTSAFAGIEITNQTCICDSDGMIELTTEPDQGFDSAGPFTFKWSGPKNYFSKEQNLYNLKEPGVYSVIVTNAYGCKIELSTVVETCINVELETVTCTCPGGYGMIDISVVGGSGNYKYYWSGFQIVGPGVFLEDPLVFQAGSYSVLVVDDDIPSCRATLEVVVKDCDFDLNSYLDITPDCNEEGTSTISIEIPPGTGLSPYHATWVELGTGIVQVDDSPDGTAKVKNLGPGEYCVTVLTANGCEEQTFGLIIDEALPPLITSTITPFTVVDDGAISLVLTGGTGPFYFDWSNGVNGPAASSISGLSAGLYYVTVTYGDGKCKKELSFDLYKCNTLFQQLDNGINAVVNPMTGAGDNASIDLSVTEDYPGYNFSFSWSNGETTEDIHGLAPGDYCVDLISVDCPDETAGPHCFTVCNYTVKITSSPINCNGTNLTAHVQPSGVQYKYNWSITGLTTPSTPALFGTEYCVTVTAQDGTNCESVVCTTPEQEPLAIEADVTNSTNGNDDGAITVTVTGGVSPYQYLWDDGAASPVRVNLGPGTYSVTVTDACDNMASLVITIQCEFSPAEIVAEVNPVKCSTGVLGSIELTQLPQMVNPAFHFQWSNGATTQNIYDLTANQYCVTITEAVSGCHASKCFRLFTDGTEAFGIEFETYSSCWPTSNGQITANVIGQTTPPDPPLNPPFTYQWYSLGVGGAPPQNLGNGPMITGLPSAWYSVNITDSWGCTTKDEVFLNVPKQPFTIDVTATPSEHCSLGQTSTGEVVITGGMPTGYPLEYDWQLSSPPTSYSTSVPTLSGMGAGEWMVTVTDANGCESYDWVLIEESDIQINGEVHNGCDGGIFLGSVSVSPSGGAPPYSYSWSNGATVPFVFAVAGSPGLTYDVTVTDNAGCTVTESFTIEPLPSPTVELSIVHPSTGNGQITTQVSGGGGTVYIFLEQWVHGAQSLWHWLRILLCDSNR